MSWIYDYIYLKNYYKYDLASYIGHHNGAVC